VAWRGTTWHGTANHPAMAKFRIYLHGRKLSVPPCANSPFRI